MLIAARTRFALLVVSSLSAAAAAQVQLPPAQTVVVPIFAAPPRGPDVPPPPRVLTDQQGPAATFVPVPIGTGGLPQPNTPESIPASALGGGGAPGAPCDFRFFMNNPVTPAGAIISATTGEPNVAVQGDGVLYTGNWFAARSSDSGMSWARYNPTTFFPASDGGFCCDQRALFVRNPDMVIWLLEYGYSATTQQGRLRVAFTRTTTDLKNDNFFYFDLTPSALGLPAGRLLDYSDIAYSNGFLYGSAIVLSPPNVPQGLVMWRANLFDIWDLGGVGISFYSSATLGGFGSYRFAQGCTDPMYFAVHTSTTNLRVFSWADGSGTALTFDRTVAAWSGAPTPAPGPDGADWTGFQYTVNCVLSGYARFGEVGFLWTSGAIPPGRPQMFVRVARMRTSDLALIGQDDIWSQNQAWHFPTCATNAAGDVGGTIAVGGGGLFPSTAAFLVDQCSPVWGPLSNSIFALGARGPVLNRWGDYLGAGRHSVVTATFVGAGFALDSLGNATPRFAWFGRERDEPGWVAANIVASDVAGATPVAAAITVFQTDAFGRKDGVTNFTRSYPPRQALNLTAPLRAQSTGGVPHYFSHWIYQGTAQPTGQLSLAVGDLGTGPRTVVADARYRRVSTIRVDARPIAGVSITVNTIDLNGQRSGTTSFAREYLPGVIVSLTAPAQVGSNAFRYWVINGVPGQVNQTVASFYTDTDVTAVADYGTVVGNGTRWQDITAASPTAPSGRGEHAMAFHRPTGRVVLFGGQGGSLFGDTWELDGDQWAAAAPTNSPAARRTHGMAFDDGTGNVLLFGGQNASSVRFADTWSWDGTDWTQLAPTASPSPRFGSALAYDPVSRVVLLFGGNEASGAFGRWVNETWSFDGTTWTRLSPVTSPTAAQFPQLVHDVGRGVLVLTVAGPANAYPVETWEWTGNTWQPTTPANVPPGRFSGAVAHDVLRGKTVLFGGRIGAQLRDTWEWDGVDWRQRFTPVAPVARSGHAMAHDDRRHRCVLFGGFTDPFTNQADTWQYDYACEIIGEGHAGGGLTLACTSVPRIGQTLCVEFPNSQSVGSLVVGLGPPLRPPLPIGAPLMCNPGFLFASPDVVINATGNPGTVCIPIPNDPGLVGGLVTLQGLALSAALCADLTDAVAVVLQS